MNLPSAGTSRRTATRRGTRRASGDRLRRWATLALGIVLSLAAWIVVAAPVGAQAATDDLPVLEVFWARGCPYCAAEREWLPTLQADVSDLTIRQYEVTGSAANRQLLVARAAAHGIPVRGVPMTFFGESHWSGFNDAIGYQVRAAVDRAVRGLEAVDTASVIEVPFLGDVDVGESSLVAATLLIGALDGVNPCSLWVLSLLLALVLHTRSRRRVLAVGATFLLVTAGMYALYIGGLYSVLSYLSYVTWIRVALAILAGTFGVVAIKDYFWFRRGLTLSIPESRKPGIYRRMRRIAAADRPLLPVLGGTVVMAVGVSLVETPCTAGFPIVWSNLLSSRGVDTTTVLALFLLYMLVFMLDEAVVFGAAVLTMRAAKLQERHGRLLKLIGGVVMLVLAVVMVAAPTLLESVTGTVVVFGAAALVTGAVTSTTALVRRHRRHATPRGLLDERPG